VALGHHFHALYRRAALHDLRGPQVTPPDRGKARLYAPEHRPKADGRHGWDVERVLAAAGMPPVREGNAITLHWDGASAYDELLRLINGAEHTIHAMTFILGRDEVGRAIVDALARKAREGVQVRLLLDSLGCFYTRGKFVQPLRDAGGQVGIFMPMLPLRRKWSAHLRNHRKIVVVDGEVAMIGGMNLSRNFMGPGQDPDRFLDAAVFVRGAAVHDADNIFVSDWAYATEENIPPAPLKAAKPAEPPAPALLQVVASGPDVQEDVLLDAFLIAAMDVRARIWIVTPYLVPDEAIIKALALQARMGRDVRLIVPKRSNHLSADLARGPAIRELVRAGASVYAYPNGMLHSKGMLFDNRIAMTGSPNLDMRSFYYNFESTLLHYSPAEITAVETWMTSLLNECEPVDAKRPNVFREWLEGLAMLISPLL
jgi:cardiolipin synthase